MDDRQDEKNKCNSLYNLGRYEEAIECYNKAIEIDSSYASAWYRKGLCFYNLGKEAEWNDDEDKEKEYYDKAIKCYNTAIKIEPKNPEYWISKGKILEGSLYECLEKAAECYDKAIKLEPNSGYYWFLKGRVLFGVAYVKSNFIDYLDINEHKEYEEGIECIHTAIKLGLEKFEYWIDMGDMLVEQERYGEAIECFGKATEFKPDHIYAWLEKGKCLEELERYEEAIECYDNSIELSSDGSCGKEEKENCLRILEKYDGLIGKNSFNKDYEYREDPSSSELERYKDSIDISSCSFCGSTNIITDYERNEIVCGNCGIVISDNLYDK